MDTLDHAIYHIWIHLFPTTYARDEKPFGLELESNPDPLASQATALTTRPCHLGLAVLLLICHQMPDHKMLMEQMLRHQRTP